MCGIKTLFTGLKRFAEPLQVKLADSSIIQAYGQGQIELKTGTGRNLTLREVWYVPELYTVKLISVTCLNNHGIEVVFRPGRMVEAWKEGKVIFTGSTQSGLVYLDLEPLAVAHTATGPSEQSKAVTDRNTDHMDHTGVRKSGTPSATSKINL